MNKKKLKFNVKEQEQGHRMIIRAKRRQGKTDWAVWIPTHMAALLQAMENVHCQEFGKEVTEHTVFLCSNKYKIQQFPDDKYSSHGSIYGKYTHECISPATDWPRHSHLY